MSDSGKARFPTAEIFRSSLNHVNSEVIPICMHIERAAKNKVHQINSVNLFSDYCQKLICPHHKLLNEQTGWKLFIFISQKPLNWYFWNHRNQLIFPFISSSPNHGLIHLLRCDKDSISHTNHTDYILWNRLSRFHDLSSVSFTFQTMWCITKIHSISRKVWL